MRCKHGLNISDCSYCSGYIDNRNMMIEKHRQYRLNLYKKIRQYQRLSIEQADRFNLPIEDWELELFIRSTSGVKDIEALYNLALETQRTFNSMSWLWNMTYKADKFNDCNSHSKNLRERIKLYKKTMEV